MPDHTPEYEDGTGVAPVPPAPAKPPSTEDLLAIVTWAIAQGRSLAEKPHRVAVQGKNVYGEDITKYEDTGVGQEFSDVLELGTLALQQLQRGEVTPSTAATVRQAREALTESSRQFDIKYKRETGRDTVQDEQWGKTYAQSQAVLGESKRATNLKSTLDLLQEEIALGSLNAQEATTRMQAATNAANLQRNVLADWGGRALPQGAQYFPNAEPSGPLATAAQAIGGSFPGFGTGGTFGVDPAALGSTITAAQGPSVLPGLRAKIDPIMAAVDAMIRQE
mgnify:CR=1 FL=1